MESVHTFAHICVYMNVSETTDAVEDTQIPMPKIEILRKKYIEIVTCI